MNFVAKLLIPLTTLILIISVVGLLTSINKHIQLVKQIEIETGCDYLGHPEGVKGVGIFDCNGDIVNKRMK